MLLWVRCCVLEPCKENIGLFVVVVVPSGAGGGKYRSSHWARWLQPPRMRRVQPRRKKVFYRCFLLQIHMWWLVKENVLSCAIIS